jgi:hypothetical protein
MRSMLPVMFAMSLNNNNTFFKSFLIAGIIILVFGGICISIAEIIGLQAEGEGFRIIGWRFVIGGLVSICIGFIIRHFTTIYKFLQYYSRRFGIRRRSKYDDLYKP